MAYQEVTMGNNLVKTETIYPKLDGVAPNTILAEGTYTGSHEGKFGRTYYILGDDSVSVGLKDWGKLKALMEKAELVPNQSRVRITYLGKVIIEEGDFAGREANNFKLEVDA